MLHRLSRRQVLRFASPNPKVQTVRFYNVSKGWVFKLYPEGEHGLWDCRTSGQDKGYFEITVKNTGDAGKCRIQFLEWSNEYWYWEGTLAAGEQRTWNTQEFYSGRGWGPFYVRCLDATTSPYTQTDKVPAPVDVLTGFRPFAYVDSTLVAASGRVVETGQTFTTPLSGEAIVHVGPENEGKSYTVECTYQGVTKTSVVTASYTLPIVEFYFGAQPTMPDIRIESIVLIDKDTLGNLKEYKVYPEGEVPYITFSGQRAYRVTIKNYGGDAAHAYFECEGVVTMVTSPLPAGSSWTQTSAPIYNGEQSSFTAYIASGYCYEPLCPQKIETDRHEFVIGYQPTETFPSPPDRWCETGLQDPNGVGSWIQREGTLSLDTTEKIVGNASIKYVIPKGISHLDWGMINGVIDTNQYPLMLFFIKCANPEKIGLIYTVRLIDENGKKAATDAVLKTTDWSLKPLLVGEANRFCWVYDTGFNWSRIKTVEFEFGATEETTIWIDQMFFRIAPAINRKVFIKVVDKETGGNLPNITCRLGDYIDSVKFVYGGYMAKSDADGNAVIENIPVEPGSPATFYVFAEDPQGKYVQKPEDDVVVHLESSDQSITIRMTLVPVEQINWLPILIAGGLIGVAFILSQE
jgi:hypothetical protein